jgi:hypothetical protein
MTYRCRFDLAKHKEKQFLVILTLVLQTTQSVGQHCFYIYNKLGLR